MYFSNPSPPQYYKGVFHPITIRVKSKLKVFTYRLVELGPGLHHDLVHAPHRLALQQKPFSADFQLTIANFSRYVKCFYCNHLSLKKIRMYILYTLCIMMIYSERHSDKLDPCLIPYCPIYPVSITRIADPDGFYPDPFFQKKSDPNSDLIFEK